MNADFLTGVQGVQKKCMFEVEIASIPLYLTIVLSEGFNLDVLDSHGYASLYHFFMGFVGSPISYKDGCKWTGSKNLTIKGITLIYLKQLN